MPSEVPCSTLQVASSVASGNTTLPAAVPSVGSTSSTRRPQGSCFPLELDDDLRSACDAVVGQASKLSERQLSNSLRSLSEMSLIALLRTCEGGSIYRPIRGPLQRPVHVARAQYVDTAVAGDFYRVQDFVPIEPSSSFSSSRDSTAVPPEGFAAELWWANKGRSNHFLVLYVRCPWEETNVPLRHRNARDLTDNGELNLGSGTPSFRRPLHPPLLLCQHQHP